jgi:hypothetical protein
MGDVDAFFHTYASGFAAGIKVFLTANATYNFSVKFNIFDLTLMFGSGNEPTTIEQFREMFPAEYYPYNSGELLSAGVTEVISKKSDTTTLATYSVPAEIQALEGYGWSAGSVHNYVDYERKVFVKNVGRVDLGTLKWFVQTPSVGNYFQINGITPKMGGNYLNAICPLYTTVNSSSITTNSADKVIGISNATYSSTFRIRDTSYPDANTFKTAMNGVYLYYELATPIETDISAYLSDDNLIEVEAGGTLTFENQHGDNYRIPVPSTQEYMINLQEAVSNG